MNKKKEEEDSQPSKPHAGHISHQCLAAAEVTGRQIETAKSHRTPTRDQKSNSRRQPNCSSTHRKRSHSNSSPAVHRPTGRGATPAPAQLFIDPPEEEPLQPQPAVHRPTGRKPAANSPTASTPASCRNDHPPPPWSEDT